MRLRRSWGLALLVLKLTLSDDAHLCRGCMASRRGVSIQTNPVSAHDESGAGDPRLTTRHDTFVAQLA